MSMHKIPATQLERDGLKKHGLPIGIPSRLGVRFAVDSVADAEPAAHMYPSDLEKFETSETFAQAFSVAVGCPDERSVPLYRWPQDPAYVKQLKTDRDELLAVMRAVVKTVGDLGGDPDMSLEEQMQRELDDPDNANAEPEWLAMGEAYLGAVRLLKKLENING